MPKIVVIVGLLLLAGCGSSPSNEQRVTVTVVCDLPGSMPAEVEDLVTHPIESQLKSASGLVNLRSLSQTGRAVVWATFEQGVEYQRATQIVSERVAGIRQQLPMHAVLSIDPQMADQWLLVALQIAPTAESDAIALRAELATFAEYELRPKFMRIPDVTHVEIIGGSHLKHELYVSNQRLDAFDVTFGELTKALASFNHVVGEPLDDIEQLVIKSNSEGTIRVDDVAELRLNAESELDGAMVQAVLVAIGVQHDANAKAISKPIGQVLNETKTQSPSGTLVTRQVDSEFTQLVQLGVHQLQQRIPPSFALKTTSTDELGHFLIHRKFTGVEISLTGSDKGYLEQQQTKIESLLGKADLLDDSYHDLHSLRSMFVVDIDDKAAQTTDVNRNQIQQLISMAMSNQPVAVARDRQQSIPIYMRLDDDSQIGELTIRSAAGRFKLNEVAKINLVPVAPAIERENQRRIFTVRVPTQSNQLDSTTASIRTALAPLVKQLRDDCQIQIRQIN